MAHRNLLFTVAYEMLGSTADAEDVLQETWPRWMCVDPGIVRDQRAYLARITTRQALIRLRTSVRRKESYFGPWLPEPLLTTPDVADDVELADSVSMAMLLALEASHRPGRSRICWTFSHRMSSSSGMVTASLEPVVGAGDVARVLTAGLGNLATRSLRPAEVNGHPALVVRLDGEIDSAPTVRVDDGLVTGLYVVRNPEKLSNVERETTLRRRVSP